MNLPMLLTFPSLTFLARSLVSTTTFLVNSAFSSSCRIGFEVVKAARMFVLLWFSGLCDAFNWKQVVTYLRLDRKMRKYFLKMLQRNGLLWVATLASTLALGFLRSVAFADPLHTGLWWLLLAVLHVAIYAAIGIAFTVLLVENQQLQGKITSLSISRPISATAASPPKKTRDLPRKNNIAAGFDTIVDMLIFSALVQVLVVVSSLAVFIPFIGTPISLFHLALVYSLFVFDTRLSDLDSTSKSDVFSRHWAYFLGFGTPIAVSISFVSFFASTANLAILIPCYVLMAHRASPVRQPSGSTLLPEKLDTFTAILWLKDAINRFLSHQKRIRLGL